MKSAYKHYLQRAFNQGHVVHVDDGGDETIHCNTYQEALDAVEAVESATALVVRKDRSESGKWVRLGWALIIPGLDPEETVADYSVTDYNESWEREYDSTDH